jgi:phenylacetate-CoA ligase
LSGEKVLGVLYSWLVPHVVFPSYERLSGRRWWTEMLRLRELQWRPARELEARAVQKLRPLLAHAAAHVPYYRDAFRQAGIEPEDIGTLSDLPRLPITRKTDLRAGFPARVVADNLPKKRRHKALTSGSSGLPFEFYIDRTGLDGRLSSYLFFFWEWAGVAPWDTRVVVANRVPSYGQNSPPPLIERTARRIMLGERTLHLYTPEITLEQLRAETSRLASRHYVVWALPSYIGRLAIQMLQGDVELQAYPKLVVTSGETLTDVNSRSIERAFRCKVVNHYTTWEVPHIAQSCPDNAAIFHVNSERLISRVVRTDGSDAAPGEEGRVLITDLENYVMPFVNYDIGDWAVAGASCPCGRGFPILEKLQGRAIELIRTLEDTIISPDVLCNFMDSRYPTVGYVSEFQAVQTGAHSVVLRIVPTSRFNTEFEASLRDKFASFLGPGMCVQIETAEAIEDEPSGKRLIIKSKLLPF